MTGVKKDTKKFYVPLPKFYNHLYCIHFTDKNEIWYNLNYEHEDGVKYFQSMPK